MRPYLAANAITIANSGFNRRRKKRKMSYLIEDLKKEHNLIIGILNEVKKILIEYLENQEN